jgi:hypothetical protein
MSPSIPSFLHPPHQCQRVVYLLISANEYAAPAAPTRCGLNGWGEFGMIGRPPCIDGTSEKSMRHSSPSQPALKQVLKEALTETLHEQRDLLHEVFAEVLEDFALAEAIREGQSAKRAPREEVIRWLRANS